IEAATTAPTSGVDAPTKLNVNLISLNPDNPRTELGDLTDLGNSLRDHGQKTAISIMTRFAYLKANPGREKELEEGTKYVAIDGNSRLAAAREAGVEEIRVMLDDDLGSDPDQILESALVANVHRKDLDPLDEAKALQQLLQLHGTQQALAARLHRSQGWVAQRLALLNLTPELQQRLADGSEPVELLRRIGNQKPENQQKKLEELKRKQEEERAAKTAARKALKGQAAKARGADPVGGPSESPQAPASGTTETTDHYAVMKPATDAEAAGLVEDETLPTGVPDGDGGSPGAEDVPGQRVEPAPRSPSSSAAAAPLTPGYTLFRRLPWDDGNAIADLVLEWMTPEQRKVLLERLSDTRV
ncbi:ParB/RepB/Spo0J family partition protein, partial [Streptomyces roseoviridis]